MGEISPSIPWVGNWIQPVKVVCLLIITLILTSLSFYQATLYINTAELFTYNMRWNPTSWGVHTALGAASLMNKEGAEKALQHFTKAVELEPKASQAHYNRAVALEQLHRDQEAVVSYKKALALEPIFAEAHNNLGILLFRSGDYEEALIHFSVAVRLKPRNLDFKANRDQVIHKKLELQR
jgi:tetratricopeptide (TPR) repeat protein